MLFYSSLYSSLSLVELTKITFNIILIWSCLPSCSLFSPYFSFLFFIFSYLLWHSVLFSIPFVSNINLLAILFNFLSECSKVYTMHLLLITVSINQINYSTLHIMAVSFNNILLFLSSIFLYCCYYTYYYFCKYFKSHNMLLFLLQLVNYLLRKLKNEKKSLSYITYIFIFSVTNLFT